MHSRDARKAGVTEKRLYALPVWRETPMFSDREKAALELTEAITRLADSHVSDELWDRVAEQFTENELAELLWTITVVNAWNRLGAAARPWPLT
jgi:alkylhydroperoxidase family enzyme